MSTPVYRPERWPQLRQAVPDLSDPTLVGSWCHPKCLAGYDDYSPGGNDMTVNGTVKWDRHRSFIGDGASGYLRDAVANYRSADSAGTIEAWINPATVAGSRTIFGSADEAGNQWYLFFYIIAGKLNITTVVNGVSNSVEDSSASTLTDTWQHVVVTTNGSVWVLYRDGVVLPLTVGGANSGNWFSDVTNRDSITIGVLSYNATTYGYYSDRIAAVNVYSEPKTIDWVEKRRQKVVPDSRVVLWVPHGDADFSPHEHAVGRNGNTILGRRITLDGTGDFLRVPDSSEFSIVTTGALTAMCWLLFDSIVGQEYFLCKGNAGVGGQWEYAIRRSAAVFNAPIWNLAGTAERYTLTTGGLIIANTWLHVALVVDDNNSVATIYVNGVSAAVDNTPNPAAVLGDGTSALDIGQRNGDSSLAGQMSDIRVYSEALNAREILDYVERTEKYY